MYKSYKKTLAILVTCALIGALLCVPVSALDTSSYQSLPVSFNNSWLDSYGVLQPNTHHGSNYEFVVPSNYYTNDYVILSTQFYCFDNSIMSSYNDFLFTVHCKNMLLERVYLHFYEVSREFDFTLYETDDEGSYSKYKLELNNFNWLNNVFSISFVFKKDYEASSSVVLEDMYYRISDTSVILGNQNQNAQDIQNNQDKNTQSIIDNQNELAEQEKQEIQNSGNQATDAAENIPDKSAGFIEALGSFVGAMSTTSTECSLKFPGIKVPALEGYFPEVELIGEQDIDISQAIGLIPEAIMKLIQALTTIGLIVFCFKELYDTISEALTRKDSSDG